MAMANLQINSSQLFDSLVSSSTYGFGDRVLADSLEVAKQIIALAIVFEILGRLNIVFSTWSGTIHMTLMVLRNDIGFLFCQRSEVNKNIK